MSAEVSTTYGLEGLLAGRTLVDRYHVLQVIGRGGMGAVYRAWDTRLDREVAIKVVTATARDSAARARLRSRFLREARAAAQLHHPNVVAVHDFGTDPTLGLDFLVMELLRGDDLGVRMQRHARASVPTAVEILFQAAGGLAAGHRVGLIHRDVKPGNLFLETGERRGEVRVKVLDFGIVEIAESEEATLTHLTVFGRSPYSPAFASPEQLRGDPTLSPATDVFSLAAVGYCLLTGKRAYHSVDPRQMVVELSRSVGSLPREVPELGEAGQHVLRRALAPDPVDRYPDAARFAEALIPLQSDASARGMPASPSWVHAPAGAGSTGDPTQLLSEPLAHSGTRYAEPPIESRPAVQAGALAAPPSVTPPARPAAQTRRGWFRRALSAAWNLLVTVTAIGMFAGCWALILQGLDQHDLAMIYVGVAASVVLTPFAVHRLMGRRGSFGLALLGSALGTAGASYLLSRSTPMEGVLGATMLAQLLLAYAAERLSRSRSSSAAVFDPGHTPGRV